MTRLRWFLHRLTSLFRRHQRETDLDAELTFHLDAEAEDAADAGLSTADAARAARRSLGNIALAREDARAAWTWRWLEELTQDVRYAVRVLRRRPVFTMTAILSLGLGIAATTALFSLVNNLMLKPLPVERPHELVRITRPGEPNGPETWDRYERLQRQATGFAGIAGMADQVARPIDVTIDGAAATAQWQLVSSNYFDVVGVGPSVGRVFGVTARSAAAEAVAVISDDYRRRHFSSGESALGAIVRAGNIDFTVIGVGPPGFRGIDIDVPVDLWVPFERVVAPDDLNRTRGRWIQMIGRLAPGVSLDAASAEATALLDRPMVVGSGRSGFSAIRERLSQPLLLLALVVLLVLGVTCPNLANLALAGASARGRELALRQAVGASRGRVARQLTTESVVLVGASLMLGLALAPAFSGALLSFLPPQQMSALPNLRFTLDGPAFTGAVGSGLVGLLVVGVLPVVRATHGRGTAVSLHATARGQASGEWLRRTLITLEVALCTVLLMTAGVFVLSIRNLHEQDTGYVAGALLVADIDSSPRSSTGDDWVEHLHVIRDRLARLPGVRSVGFSHTGQLSGFSINGSVQIPGSSEPASTDSIEHRVSPGFLEAMGMRVLGGRALTDSDDARAPRVAVANVSFADRYFGTTDVIGRQFLRQSVSGVVDVTTIVGLVADAKWHTLREDKPVMYFVPYRQHRSSSVTFAMRSTGDLRGLAAQIPAIVASVDAGMVTSDIVPFTDIVNRTLVVERLIAHVASAFAAFGLVIACVGLYGVLAFAVVRRTREIGLRIALGARPRSVEWLFLRETVILLLTGFAVGVPAAYLVTRSVSSLLFGLEPGDPMTTAAVMALLSVTALAASWIPARRAAAIDPMRALREE